MQQRDSAPSMGCVCVGMLHSDLVRASCDWAGAEPLSAVRVPLTAVHQHPAPAAAAAANGPTGAGLGQGVQPAAHQGGQAQLCPLLQGRARCALGAGPDL